MSIVIYNGSTGLIDKIGHLAGIARLLLNNRATVKSRLDSMQAAFAAADKAMLASVASYYYRSTSAAEDRAIAAVRADALRTLIGVVDADTPLASKDAPSALRELIRQMTLSGDTISKNTVSASTAYEGTPTGNGSFAFPSLPQTVYAQKVRALCVADSYTGASSGRELFQITTPSIVSDPFDSTFRRGSGASMVAMPLDYFDGPAQGPGLQQLNNGSLSTWDGATPRYWTVPTGSSLVASTAVALRGSMGAILTGDGVTMQELRATFDDTYHPRLRPNTTYIFGVWVKTTAAPAGGTIEVELYGDSGALATVIVADATLSGSWYRIVGSYTTGDKVPTAPYLRIIRRTAALAVGKNIYASCAFFAETQRIGAGTGAESKFLLTSGSTDFRQGDRVTATFANNWSSPVQDWFDRLFGTGKLALELPSDAVPTIPDGVVP